MSVIISRALPDVRDGLKPVQRRILYAMFGEGATAGSSLQEVRRLRRPGDEALSPARRRLHLRRDGPDGPALLAPLPAGRRPGQLRLGRWRPARGDAVHRVAALPDLRRDARRHQQEHGRFRGELRRHRAAADRAAGAHTQPPDQRRHRHRGRHDDQHPTPQPARGRGGREPPDRQPRRHLGGPEQLHQGSGLSDRRHHHGHRGDPVGLRDRPRPDHRARPPPLRGGGQRQGADHHLRAPLRGQQGQPGGEDRRAGLRPQARGHRRPHRRVGPRRHADRHRAQARRAALHRPQQPLQAHLAAADVRRHHAGAGRQPARSSWG